jgi:hypothetical protein
MRSQLLDGLTMMWQEACRALSSRSPVEALDRLLTAMEREVGNES